MRFHSRNWAAPIVATMLFAPFPVRAIDQLPSASHVSIAITKPADAYECDCQVVLESVGTSTWLGLFRDDSGYAWKATRVQVQWAPNPLSEDGKSRWTSKVIRVADQGQPIFLLKGMPELEKVSIHAAQYVQRKPSDASPSELKIQFNSSFYEVRMLAESEKEKKAELVLISGSRRQVIDRLDPNGKDWQVVWAGDLDGDGKLDLLLYAEDDDVSSHLKLMLSTKARPGEIVHTVAQRAFIGD